MQELQVCGRKVIVERWGGEKHIKKKKKNMWLALITVMFHKSCSGDTMTELQIGEPRGTETNWYTLIYISN